MPGLHLDDQLCFSLYSASRAMTAAYRPLLTELNLTYPQYLVMLVLWDEPCVTVGRLGELLQLDSGTLSPLLKRLETGGYIERERLHTDERQVEVRLTSSGTGLRHRAECIPEQMLTATGMTMADAGALRDAIRMLNDALCAAPLTRKELM